MPSPSNECDIYASLSVFNVTFISLLFTFIMIELTLSVVCYLNAGARENAFLDFPFFYSLSRFFLANSSSVPWHCLFFMLCNQGILKFFVKFEFIRYFNVKACLYFIFYSFPQSMQSFSSNKSRFSSKILLAFHTSMEGFASLGEVKFK